MRMFNAQGLDLPRRDRHGDLRWTRASVSAVIAILKNPAYAGAVRPELSDAHHTWGWRRKAREGRSASRREDPIHLGAATRQRGGAIRRAERREQWAEAWKPRSGSALAETERLSASERPSKVRNRRTGPRGWWPGPKGQRVGSPDGTTGDGDTNSRRTKGRSRPGRISPSGNRVSPIRPVARRKPDRKGG
jgi:hypothetical protein